MELLSLLVLFGATQVAFQFEERFHVKKIILE
jgi:hypothetical protein